MRDIPHIITNCPHAQHNLREKPLIKAAENWTFVLDAQVNGILFCPTFPQTIFQAGPVTHSVDIISTSCPARGRTVVLGLDSMDLLLAEKLAAQGHMPFFKRLLEHSPLTRLSTVSRVLQGALWPNLLSGRSPGHHGTYFNVQLQSGTYGMQVVGADYVKIEPFYERLSANGVRSAVVDVPNDLVQPSINGLQVVDWLTEFQYWKFETRPTGLKQDIESKFGTLAPTGGYGPTIDSIDGHRALRGRMEKSLRIKTEFTKDLLRQPDLDFIFIVFAEPHKAGHHLWKYMDETHPDHVANQPDLKDAIPYVYRSIDNAFAEFASMLKPEDNLMVLSDHGMQPNYRGDHMMAQLVEQLGLSTSAGAARIYEGAAPQASFGSKLKTTLRQTVRKGLVSIASPAMVANLRRRYGVAAGVDWSRIQAFILPTDRNSYLRVNLRGREPNGVVEPGREYDALLDRIEKEFRTLINVDTDRPAVEEVFRVHKLYPGPHRDGLPDIAILWSAEAPIKSLQSPTLGRLDLQFREDRSGNHRAEGFMLAQGPAFVQGPAQLQGDILQIAPTFLKLHGIPSPDSYEMGPIASLFADKQPRSAASV